MDDKNMPFLNFYIFRKLEKAHLEEFIQQASNDPWLCVHSNYTYIPKNLGQLVIVVLELSHPFGRTQKGG